MYSSPRGITHFKPLEQFKVQNGPIRHVGQRIISKKSRAEEIKAPAKMCQGSRMDHVITCKGARVPVKRGKIDAYMREELADLLIFESLLSLCLELPRSLVTLSSKKSVSE